MFYRYTRSGARVSCDLDGLYDGGTVFLLGGAPSLDDLTPPLEQPGIVTLAVNNVPRRFPRPSLWICADKPKCFDPFVYTCPSALKFTMISRRFEEVPKTGGKKAWQVPSMFFFGASSKFKVTNFLSPSPDLVWWKSVFPMALQLAWRLGFKKVCLVGCSFHMDVGQPYAWETDLDDDERSWSQRTYNKDLERLKVLKPVFDAHQFRVVSCTPGSRANDLLGYEPVEMAVAGALSGLPDRAHPEDLIHSSKAGPGGGTMK